MNCINEVSKKTFDYINDIKRNCSGLKKRQIKRLNDEESIEILKDKLIKHIEERCSKGIINDIIYWETEKMIMDYSLKKDKSFINTPADITILIISGLIICMGMIILTFIMRKTYSS